MQLVVSCTTCACLSNVFGLIYDTIYDEVEVSAGRMRKTYAEISLTGFNNALLLFIVAQYLVFYRYFV